MKKGGLADSPFFRIEQPVKAAAAAPVVVPRKEKPQSPLTRQKVKKKPQQQSGNGDPVTPRHRDTMVDTTIPRHHDTIIETVRKAVKEFGKEAATHRFTLAEKKAIADIIYTYRQRGVKTSENELARIAINYLISDYEQNGESSILHQVIEALNT